MYLSERQLREPEMKCKTLQHCHTIAQIALSHIQFLRPIAFHLDYCLMSIRIALSPSILLNLQSEPAYVGTREGRTNKDLPSLRVPCSHRYKVSFSVIGDPLPQFAEFEISQSST